MLVPSNDACMQGWSNIVCVQLILHVISSSYNMPTRVLSEIHKVILRKPEGVYVMLLRYMYF